MLRYSIWPLPAEIYAMIYSHLSVNHLAAVQETCRMLFTITTPYVWQSVDIESLLRLLPGCISEGKREPTLNIATPCPIPDGYLSRFFFYSRFVKCLKITPQFMISGSFQDALDELAVQASSTSLLILPALGEVKLTMIVENSQRRYRDEYADYKFWIDALIPQTIKRISFEAYSNHNESLLGAIISKAPELTHLEFASEARSARFYEQIVGPNQMRHVRFLRYSGSIMDPDVMNWFTEMPQLSVLELTLDQEDSEEPHIPEMDDKPEAFQALTTLKVFTCDHAEVAEQWILLRQLWRTPLVKHLTCVELKLSGPIYPDMQEFDQFMTVLVDQSPQVSSLRIEASGTPEHFPEIPIEVLSETRRLPLRALYLQSPIHLGVNQSLFKSLGAVYSKLEVLDLGSSVVEVSDILNAHHYLPRLRYLNIGVWSTKVNKERLQRTLFSLSKASSFVPLRPPNNSYLSICFRSRRLGSGMRAYTLDFSDVHVVALLLSTYWAIIHVHGDLLADRMDELRTRIDIWRGKADRNWDRLVECVVALFKGASRDSK
ncbi:unnamed protein product [Rhizoctonia solani]|uniref:F-box domain-containing protein n=1 Tax=Rhizoctonia solani TaxID=456999 RepID=A0A8H2WJV1_9AGAM|nr:unnamed protein product [Rhizoctonia solani]